MEWDLQFRSNNNQEDGLSALREWTRLYHAALDASAALSGRKMTRVSQIEDMVRAARFEGVRCEVLEIPTCAWSRGKETCQASETKFADLNETDTRLRRIGEHNLVNMSALIESIARYPVVNRGICSKEIFDEIIQSARDELANEDAQPYLRL